MADNRFGPVVTGSMIERAAKDTLATWAPDYLGYVSREVGRRRTMPPIRSWVAVSEVEKWPAQQLPSVLVLSPGITGTPKKSGRGVYTARFSLGFAVVVAARERESVLALAQDYTAALRNLLLDKGGALGGLGEGIEWLDEDYDPLPGLTSSSGDQLAAGKAVFVVDVPNVAGSRGGPSTPSPTPNEPQPDWPVVTSAEVVMEAVPTTEDP